MKYDNKILYLILTLVTFNALDGVSTVWWVTNNLAVELNPLMDFFLTRSPALFMAVKQLITGVACAFLWKYRDLKQARRSLYFCVVVYGLIILWHLVGYVGYYFVS